MYLRGIEKKQLILVQRENIEQSGNFPHGSEEGLLYEMVEDARRKI